MICRRCKADKLESDFFFRHSKGVVRQPCKACHSNDYNRLVVSKRPKPIMFVHKDEKWLSVVGYEGLYEVSDYGNVRSTPRGKNKGGILRLVINNEGYPAITLCMGGVKKKIVVHRLVAEAHIPNPNNLPVVNHKDGIKPNNNIGNLEWCTFSENSQHAYDTGLTKCRFGENHQVAKYSDELVISIYNESGTHQGIADKYGIDRRYVSLIKSGKTRSKTTGASNKAVDETAIWFNEYLEGKHDPPEPKQFVQPSLF